VIDRDLNTPGNLRSILSLKLKNISNGNTLQSRVRPQDKVEQAYLDKREAQYLYRDGDDFIFMDQESFEQTPLHKDWVGDQIFYLKENDIVHLKVVETDPALKGATAAAQFKPAILETGLKITVPPFIGIGEFIAIDTRTGEYLSRYTEGK
jgi:elongation factor P